MKNFINIIIPFLIVVLLIVAGVFWWQHGQRVKVLEQIVERLNADSRVAEVLVTEVKFDEATRKHMTTIKFLEYDAAGRPLEPRYFTFKGNVIQFQSLVIRFDDQYVKKGSPLKGKSAYLFWKVFMLDSSQTQEFTLTPYGTIPQSYKLDEVTHRYERKLWQHFWDYALDPKQANQDGIKNAQIEAPGTVFVPGVLYTIRIEHDGGLRIDARPLSPIFQGETMPK